MVGIGKGLRAAVLAAVAVGAALAFRGDASAGDLMVFAAASLQESMTAAADAFATSGHARPVISFGASSALARQVENGAPADLFVSADEQWMDYLSSRSLLAPGTRTAFLGNTLVLVAPASRPFTIEIRYGFDLASVLGSEKLAMADPDSVPAGRYGKAALVALGAWTRVEGNVARSADVRAALALVERDEARAGIVYRTDAMASTAVTTVAAFPASSHPPIVYSLAILSGRDGAEARAFRDYLLSDPGRAHFSRRGFASP